MILRYTGQFEKWLDKLPLNVREIVEEHINRISDDKFPNCKPLREGISEIKIYYQKGYRVYFTCLENGTVLFLLMGSDKDRQSKAIEKAIKLKRLLKAQGVI